MLGFVTQIVIHNGFDIIHVLFKISVLVFIIVSVWCEYNFRRYGRLNRRSMPSIVSIYDVIGYFELDFNVVDGMQSGKVLVLAETIV